jgi:ribosomal protein S18 acetylase RimI-like enzyme
MQKPDRDEKAFQNVRLRPVTLEDETFLRELFATTRADELALMGWDEQQKELFIAMQFNAQSQQYAMSYPQANHSVILLDEVSIGRQIINRGPSEFTLVDIALLPTYRGAGIGTQLIENLLREAASARKSVTLNVWHSNPARNLYERMGFSAATKDDGVYCEMWWTPESITNELLPDSLTEGINDNGR